MATVKFRLSTSVTNKVVDTLPLVIQIIHRRKKRILYTPYRLYREEFNISKECAMRFERTYPINEINTYITRTRIELLHIINELDQSDSVYEAEDVFHIYKRKNTSLFFPFVRSLITGLKKQGRAGTANLYITTINHLHGFTKKKVLLFTEINSTFVEQFRSYLHSIGMKLNSQNLYLRIFKAMYHKAQLEGATGVASDPFVGFKMPVLKTNKRAVTEAMLRKIANADLSASPHLEKSRDTFILSFYLRGIPFVDLAYLQEKNINHHYLCYSRNKTGQPLEVYIEKEISDIFKKYKAKGNTYLLGYLDERKKQNLYIQYRNALRRYNRHLKEISTILNLNILLTSYVARHTWATTAHRKNVPVSVISEGLGHASEQITYTYLASIGQARIDTSNRKLIKMLGM